jgi:hypothetical protein
MCRLKATISDPNYTGSANGTLRILPADARLTITFSPNEGLLSLSIQAAIGLKYNLEFADSLDAGWQQGQTMVASCNILNLHGVLGAAENDRNIGITQSLQSRGDSE